MTTATFNVQKAYCLRGIASKGLTSAATQGALSFTALFLPMRFYFAFVLFLIGTQDDSFYLTWLPREARFLKLMKYNVPVVLSGSRA
jgi:hypothetical protein